MKKALKKEIFRTIYNIACLRRHEGALLSRPVLSKDYANLRICLMLKSNDMSIQEFKTFVEIDLPTIIDEQLDVIAAAAEVGETFIEYSHLRVVPENFDSTMRVETPAEEREWELLVLNKPYIMKCLTNFFDACAEGFFARFLRCKKCGTYFLQPADSRKRYKDEPGHCERCFEIYNARKNVLLYQTFIHAIIKLCAMRLRYHEDFNDPLNLVFNRVPKLNFTHIFQIEIGKILCRIDSIHVTPESLPVIIGNIKEAVPEMAEFLNAPVIAVDPEWNPYALSCSEFTPDAEHLLRESQSYLLEYARAVNLKKAVRVTKCSKCGEPYSIGLASKPGRDRCSECLKKSKTSDTAEGQNTETANESAAEVLSAPDTESVAEGEKKDTKVKTAKTVVSEPPVRDDIVYSSEPEGEKASPFAGLAQVATA